MQVIRPGLCWTAPDPASIYRHLLPGVLRRPCQGLRVHGLPLLAVQGRDHPRRRVPATGEGHQELLRRTVLAPGIPGGLHGMCRISRAGPVRVLAVPYGAKSIHRSRGAGEAATARPGTVSTCWWRGPFSPQDRRKTFGLNFRASGATLRPKRAIVGGHRGGGRPSSLCAAWEVKQTWENMPAMPINKREIIWPLPAWPCRVRVKCHGVTCKPVECA
jgi:hypothetical protein